LTISFVFGGPSAGSGWTFGDRLGIGYTQQHAYQNRELDRVGYLSQLNTWGVESTESWLMNSWGFEEHQQPWLRLPNGRYDLTRYSNAWLDELANFDRNFRRGGGRGHVLCLQDRYWLGKDPTLNPLHPYRNNINGVYWSVEDDYLYNGVDWVLINLLSAIWVHLGYLPGPIKIANEFKEKPWHFAMAGALQANFLGIELICNRQEDSPGQFVNMEVGSKDEEIDILEIHSGGAGGPEGTALRHGASALDASWPEEVEAGRPDTIRKLVVNWLPEHGHRANSLHVSSDGGRLPNGDVTHAYDYPNLEEIAEFILGAGGSFMHQSCIKMANPHTVANMQYDDALMRSLRRFNTR